MEDETDVVFVNIKMPAELAEKLDKLVEASKAEGRDSDKSKHIRFLIRKDWRRYIRRQTQQAPAPITEKG